MIGILQKNDIIQGKFTDILGTYRMGSDQNVTADNTEHFFTAGKQHLSDEKIFSLAQDFAIKLKQESVAVFIPNPAAIGSVTVNFTSHQPTIDEIVDEVHKNLPAFYSQAFSLHLAKTCDSFNEVRVDGIEWLGSKVKPDEIKKAFPNDKMTYQFGKVFLVYQNGQKEPL